MSAPMAVVSIMETATARKLGLLILSVCFMCLCTVSSDDEDLLPFLSPSDIQQLHRHACIIAGSRPVPTEILQTLSQLQKIFHHESGVLFGKVNLESFTWPDGMLLKWKGDVTEIQLKKDLVLFQRKSEDRTCLVKPPVEPHPEAHYYTGSYSIQDLTNFINSFCDTHRTTSGLLTSAGKHRELILNNLFSVNKITNITMATLYSSYNNPLNNSFAYTSGKCQLPVDTAACVKPEGKFKYGESTNMKTFIPECLKMQGFPSKDEFFHHYLKLSKPVVFKDSVRQWPAFKKWSNEFLRAEFGQNNVHIKLTPNGDYEGVEPAHIWENYETFKIPDVVKQNLRYSDLVVVRPATMDIKFSKFLDLVESIADQKTNNISAYLEYSSIPQYMPELEKDIIDFPFMQKLLLRKHLNIWLSDGHTLGRLHFDPFDNLLCQISGKKQVILFEPHDSTRLYEGHIPQATLSLDPDSMTFHRKTLQDSTSMVMSPVNLLHPDFDRFPKFENAQPLNCTLSEGDVLFMPSFWWHEVQSFPSQTEKRNLAINFWYEPFLTKEFPCAECKLDVNSVYRHLL